MPSEEPRPAQPPSEVSPGCTTSVDVAATSEDASGNLIPLPADIWTDLDPAAKALILALLQVVEENKVLRARVDALEERLRTNSTNTSKPPSTDPPRIRRKNKKRSKRRRGAQKGHPGHYRELAPPEQVDKVVPSLRSTALLARQVATEAPGSGAAPAVYGGRLHDTNI